MMRGGGGPGLYTIADDGTHLTRINTAAAAPAPAEEAPPRGRGGFGGGGFGDPQWAKDGRSLYYLQGGGIYSVGITPSAGGDSAALHPVALVSVRPGTSRGRRWRRCANGDRLGFFRHAASRQLHRQDGSGSRCRAP